MSSDDIRDLRSQINARLPSLPALRCFDAAARLESFSRAADALHLTHGAVSRAVRLLEEDLGVALFHRRNRRVFLTDAGRRFAVEVRQGFGVIEAAVDGLRRERPRRSLVVSCEPTLLMRWLIPRLPGLQASHPTVDLHLVAGGGPVRLGDGVDLAIRRDDFTIPPDMHRYQLFEERTGPVCRADRMADFFAETEGRIVLRDDAPLLHSRTRPEAWDTWTSLAALPKIDHPGRALDHFYFSLQAAVAGMGVAIGPWQLVRDEVASGILCAPLGFLADGTTYQLLSDAPLEPATPAGLFLDWLRAEGL